MLKVLKALLATIWNFLGTIFTGGKYGSSVRANHSSEYAAYQEQKRKDFEKFGTHECKICGTKIPGDKSYCGACYYNYKK